MIGVRHWQALAIALAALSACSDNGGVGEAATSGAGAGASGGGTSGEVVVVIDPESAIVTVGASRAFTATVTGADDATVVWSVSEGGASVSAEGSFTAPATAGVFHVVATSVAEPSASASATVTVTQAATGEEGVWENVTGEIDLDPALGGGNFGVQDVLVDPARPTDFYAFVCYQGVWKSVDYGLTWNKVSKNGGPIDLGRPWAAGIDPNPRRDPRTPPVLYTAQGYGSEQGFWRSLDGGVEWTRYDLGDVNDMGSMAVDPSDVDHVLVGLRTNNHVLESNNGGETWDDLGPVDGAGNNSHVKFVTSTVWLMVSEWGDGTAGTRRSENAGSSWSKVSSCERFHGSTQPFVAGGGVIYAPCVEGILRSDNDGATWTPLIDGATSAVVGTERFVYAATGWATQGTWDPNLRRTTRARDASWDPYYGPAPPDMTNGPHGVAVGFDGTRYVIVSGNWLAGLWRYLEPAAR
jgi:hypothetical protein